MKKIKLKYYAIICIILIFIMLYIPINAATQDNTISCLVKNGYVQKTAEALPLAERLELVQTLEENINSVDISTTYLEIDRLEELENIVATSDEEFIKAGFTKDEINEKNNYLSRMRNATDIELMNFYGYGNIWRKKGFGR